MKNAAPTWDIWAGKYERLCVRGKTTRERKRRVVGGEEELKPILQQRLQYVYPMKPSNTVPTLSVTTSECTITFYKGRMKCQNWFERGGLRYKWAAEVAILLQWPFIWCPWIISRKKKELEEHEGGVGGHHTCLRWQQRRKPHTHTHTRKKKRQKSKRRTETPEESFKFPTTL